MIRPQAFTRLVLSTLVLVPLAAHPAWTPDADEFAALAAPGAPALRVALRTGSRNTDWVFEVASPTNTAAEVTFDIGIAAARSVVRTVRGTRGSQPDLARGTLSIPAAALVDGPADWNRLRLAVAVRWAGGPGGTDRRRERYHQGDAMAPAAGLATNPAAWLPFDLAEYTQRTADLRSRLLVPAQVPMDGKLTVVIEDAAGRRVRNLVSGIATARGLQRLEWDGCDEEGRLVREGRYHWRAIAHPGIVPDYAMGFCNADEPGYVPLLSNHCHFQAAGANTDLVVLAAVGTEGGFAMAAFDRNGRWRQGFNPILGAGWNAVAVALDSQYLYAAHDGEGWGLRIDKTKTNWAAEVALTLTRFDLNSGAVVDYRGPTPGRRWAELEQHGWGPGTPQPALRQSMSLSGMALFDGRLYIGSRNADALLVVDPRTGTLVDTMPLPQPGAVASGAGRLVAVSAGHLVAVDAAAHRTQPLFSPALEQAAGLDQAEIRAVALDDSGNCFVADGRSHTVKTLDAAGKTGTLGVPGGAYAGAWQTERMVAPSGLAVLGNRLWVAEDRTLPKRAVAWDLATRRVVRQVFGNPAYGGPGAGFDPRDPTQWVGEGARWSLDVGQKTAACQGILGWTATGPMHWRYIRQAGHTYLLGMGMANVLTRVGDDGTLHPVAAWASAHCFSYAHDWHPPAGFVEAFNAAYPDQPFTDGTSGRPNHGPGVLWVDRNGDGAMQAAEFEFTGTNRMAGAAWGHDAADLTIRLPAVINNHQALVALAPAGVDAQGVPRYPRLKDAIAAAVPLQDLPTPAWTGLACASSVDRAGDLVLLSDPMTAWAPDGTLRWRYPNRWSNVHGSHDAPLPETGVMQGTLFILGMAPLDATNDVFIINGNHGRFFVVTSDGLYLDEMFNDCRVAQTRDAMLVGGECFGGVFGRSDDGTYWLQTGGEGYRVYRIKGLDQVRRSEGEIVVTAAHLQAAQRRAERRQAATAGSRVAPLQALARAPSLDGTGNGWPPAEPLVWSKAGGACRVSVRLGCDATNLYLRYEVADPSPWVNNGTDWTLLFKTGDSIDLQLATDPAAPANRRTPAPGDVRLLIAPMGTQQVAVVYRHRVPGTKQGMAFSSPWRTETVDQVQRLDTARIAVRKSGDAYAVDAAVRLADLGFAPRPGGAWKADLGVIYGDDAGTINLMRNYWANQATGLVNDVPGEIMLQPDLWGTLTMEAP